MKKTWIKIKRGLLEQKHRDSLGIRIWLYIYILDQADWDTGQVLEWRDGDAADELVIPMRTIRQQRKQLADDGYITCEQAYRKQIITIHNYSNPRKYDGEILNNDGDINLTPLPDGDINGDINGDNNGYRNIATISYKPQITDHKPEEEGATNLYQLYESSIGPLTGTISEELKTLEDDYPAMWITDAFAIAKKNKATHLKYVVSILGRWNANGKDDGYKKGKAKGTGGYAGPDMSAFDKIRQQEVEHENH